MSKQNLIIIVIISTIILVSIGFWYSTTLQQAQNQRKSATTRLISSSNTTQSTILSSPNTTKSTTKTGKFVTLDPVHYASGNATLISNNNQNTLELSSDFATNPDGPDLYVWLVKTQKLGGAIGGVNTDQSTYLNLGSLSNKTGKQQYSITQAESEQYNYAVVIWCQAFGVQFSNAVLQ